MGKWIEGLMIGVFITVLGGIILSVFGYPISDFFNSPETITIAQYGEEVCPTGIYFNYDKTADFSIQLKNSGDDGSLYVFLSSDKILSKTNNEKEFGPNSTKIWAVDSKQVGDFKFKIKPKDEKLDDFRITLKYGCYEEILGKEILCTERTLCCNYKKDENRDIYGLNNKLC